METTYRGCFAPLGTSNPTDVVGSCAVTRTDIGRFKVVLPKPYYRLVAFGCDLMSSVQDDSTFADVRFTDGPDPDDGKTLHLQLFMKDEDQCFGVDSPQADSDLSALNGSTRISYWVTVDDTPLLAPNYGSNGGTDVIGG